ncbi:Protein of unknown function (DUF1005) [Abeliophyllum distichum]|uniref:Uncharacterized protein n=1 Tax=Abeliophyllum distichum TaxID=126358 RepID=A0ABD1VYL2_9LAMI
MVTPFVPSQGSDRVSRSNPGAWLILRPGHNTWIPWGRMEARRERNRCDQLGYDLELIPDGGIDSIPLANSTISMKTRSKFSIEDVAVFVALTAAMDLSMDACRMFSHKLRKELRQPDQE